MVGILGVAVGAAQMASRGPDKDRGESHERGLTLDAKENFVDFDHCGYGSVNLDFPGVLSCACGAVKGAPGGSPGLWNWPPQPFGNPVNFEG